MVSLTARAEGNPAAQSSLKQAELISTGKFHGLTFKCQLDESDEIEPRRDLPLGRRRSGDSGCKRWKSTS